MNDGQALPFFLQYLETQVAPSEDTLSAESGTKCDPYKLQTSTYGGGCILDTLKYPSDHDEQPIGR
ncbi:MAG TPA: microviridin/marinostatin family tricyclic proteinase inhibitor [Myxococcota bacterium]|nr:microviridin/marinostatin family tricyclic proteinase inhibitor [Myxococcota bacterium]